MKSFRCNLGGEYTSNDFIGFLKSDGTIYQTSCTDTLQENGVAERKHRLLVETTRSFLLFADVPSVFWGEAVLIAIYVINRIPTAHIIVSFSLFIAFVHRLHEPESYRVAVCDPLWQVAMVEELVALHQTHTYKARLISQGYAQEYGKDYEEKFAPVAKMTMVRTLIVVASSRKWKISQLDVKNAFLNGDLNEYFFMTPPLGVSHKPREGCNLIKALYGLKQAPHAWYEKFATVATSLSFISSHLDSALFVKHSSAKCWVFAMKDLGLLRYFLGGGVTVVVDLWWKRGRVSWLSEVVRWWRRNGEDGDVDVGQ
ncbi:gag-pol polyprotein [Tanacetum coccineum]